MSRRTERVGNVIRNVIANALQTQLNDPRIERFTSVTRVEVAPDFATARVHVSVMASEARRHLTVEALQRAAGRLRHELRAQMTTRQIPTLTFFLDESIQQSAALVQTLDELMAEQDGEGADSTDADQSGQ